MPHKERLSPFAAMRAAMCVRPDKYIFHLRYHFVYSYCIYFGSENHFLFLATHDHNPPLHPDVTKMYIYEL